MKNSSAITKKILLIVILMFMMIFPLGKKCYADESDAEEWIESEEVFLDKVRYETKTRKLTVEITQKKEDIAHEYELYMLIEGELDESIGRFLSLGRILSILGIMTVDTSDRVKVYSVSAGKIVISDQELYFGNSEAVTPGTKVLIGVEALDENYNPSKSNLVELTVGEETAEAGAVNAIDVPGGPNVTSDNQSSGGMSLLPFIIGAVALLAAAGFIVLSRKNKNGSDSRVSANEQKPEKGVKEKEEAEDERSLPSLEDKSVFVNSDNEQLIKVLKSKHYLEVQQPEENEEEPVDPDEAAAESEAHLYICDVKDEDRLNDLLNKKEELLKKIPLGLVLEKSLLEKVKSRLEQLKQDKKISGYISEGADKNEIMIRLILPILKPDLKSDASLENIGMICDLLGIPGVSSLISTYISGRDIKETIEEGEIGFGGTASIISNVASIMGMDTLASVSGLVGDLEAMRDAGEEDAGANERKNGILGVKDIVDVVNDLTDKS